VGGSKMEETVRRIWGASSWPHKTMVMDRLKGIGGGVIQARLANKGGLKWTVSPRTAACKSVPQPAKGVNALKKQKKVGDARPSILSSSGMAQ